eukprot:7172540-Ditylum_brightwellii.AAC.1
MCKDNNLVVKEHAYKEDGEVFFSKNKVALSQMKWENHLRHRNVHREDDEVYWDEMVPDIDGFASTKDTLSHETKREMVYEVPYVVLYDEESQSSQSL